MHEWYAMQILKKKKKQIKKKQQRGMVTNNRTMKHKDYVKKTQLNRVFCIQNFLDATLVLELLFILEWWTTLGCYKGLMPLATHQ